MTTDEQNDAPTPAKPSWNEPIRTIIYAVLLALVFRSFAYEPFHIPSSSMKSNLLIGDYLFVSKFSYGYSRYSFPLGLPIFEGRIFADAPKRGDVVVFRLPRYPRIDYIKRIVGLPGDKIQVRDGLLYINGQQVKREPIGQFVDNDEPNRTKVLNMFTETLPEGRKFIMLKERINAEKDNTEVYEVPAGHYFAMGDNRDNSRDSRYTTEVGFIPAENLVGRATMIFFSTDGSADLLKPWTWFSSFRLNRFFKSID